MKNPLMIIAFVCTCLSFKARSQGTANPYHINGNAWQENCNCYTLTNDELDQSGSVWNINKIDLRQSFDFKFNVNLGCRDVDGADGIVFVLQNQSTSIGTEGEGLGYEGVTPSIGITLDTWQNTNRSDPSYDHIAIHKNGDINHSTSNNLAGPVYALRGVENIEDCCWYFFRIVWDAASKTLRADFDGVERVKISIDLVDSIFSGDPKVFWGFSGATGGAKNRQRFCTSLNAKFNVAPNQVTCFPTPVPFNDSSTSFGSIVKWYWNFGDGTVDSSGASPPAHKFPAPGIYQVKLNILGNNGCLSDTMKQTIVIGSKPVSYFSTKEIVCENDSIMLRDSSYVQYGSVNKWNWNIGTQPSSVEDPGTLKMTTVGSLPVDLKVETKEGCESTVYSRVIETKQRPRIDFSIDTICANSNVLFAGNNLTPAVKITKWIWDYGDNKIDSAFPARHFYADGGKYAIKVRAVSEFGCPSNQVVDTLLVYETDAFAGNDTVVLEGKPFQLQGSGGEFYRWYPSTGLNDPTLANPTAELQFDQSFSLKAYTAFGCESFDTIKIKVYKGPAFYIPSGFTPNNDGKNDKFRCIAVGMDKVDFFRVYNRYGQLVYSSTAYEPGWDGTVNGIKQPTGTYVWMARGIDFRGKVHMERGTVTLLR